MRVLFAGTPEVAVPSLQALVDSEHEVVGVLTRPDAPVGRRRRLTPSPVRARADELGLPVLTPTTLRDDTVIQTLRDLAIDVAAVVAYGALVPPASLAVPQHGWINLHFSLLPAWRGAAPAQRAVLAGQTRTGMSVFQLEQGLDTGPLLATEEVEIGELETAGQLLERMSQDGAGLLQRTVDALGEGQLVATPQSSDGITHAAKLTSAEARIDFSRPAEQASAHIRGMSPHPGAWTMLNGDRFKILGLEHVRATANLDPGQLAAIDGQVLVGTGTTPLALGTVAPAGKRAMAAADWARGTDLSATPRFEPPTSAQHSTDTGSAS